MRHFTFSIAALAVLTAASATAAQFQATAGLGTAGYKYDFEGWPTYNYQFLDFGFNAGIEDFYLNFNAMVPITVSKEEFEDTKVETEFVRYQYSLNLGYRIYPRFSVFAGVNYAQSGLSIASEDFAIIDEIGYHVGIAGAPFYFQNVGAITAKLGFSFGNSFKVDFAQDLNDNGAIDYTENGSGVVFGIGWSGIITREWSYYFNFDGYSYSYKNDDYDSTTKSTLATLKAGVGYAF